MREYHSCPICNVVITSRPRQPWQTKMDYAALTAVYFIYHLNERHKNVVWTNAAEDRREQVWHCVCGYRGTLKELAEHFDGAGDLIVHFAESRLTGWRVSCR